MVESAWTKRYESGGQFVRFLLSFSLDTSETVEFECGNCGEATKFSIDARRKTPRKHMCKTCGTINSL